MFFLCAIAVTSSLPAEQPPGLGTYRLTRRLFCRVQMAVGRTEMVTRERVAEGSWSLQCEARLGLSGFVA